MKKVKEIHPIASILLFISAYSPLSLILLLQDYNIEEHKLGHQIYSISLLILGVLSVIFLFVSISSGKKSTQPVIIEKIENGSNELLNYSIPYLLAFVFIDLTELKMILSFMIFMIILYILTLRTNNVFLNPILAFKYNLYHVVYRKGSKTCKGYFLASNKTLEVGNRCRIKLLCNNMFIVSDINPEV